REAARKRPDISGTSPGSPPYALPATPGLDGQRRVLSDRIIETEHFISRHVIGPGLARCAHRHAGRSDEPAAAAAPEPPPGSRWAQAPGVGRARQDPGIRRGTDRAMTPGPAR